MIDGSGMYRRTFHRAQRRPLTYQLIELCYSGRYAGRDGPEGGSCGGMYDYLGTKDMEEVEKNGRERG